MFCDFVKFFRFV